MATLIGEDRARKFSVDNRQRSFIVRAANRDEYAEEIIAACGVDWGDFHPNNAGYYAKDPTVEQDSGCWWKWTVNWDYARITADEDPENNPEDNPLLREPQMTYDTQTISIASPGGYDDDGELIPYVSSAGEPYDPPPEEDLEILIISITRWESPGFSLSEYFNYQNSANSDAVTIGDLGIQPGFIKLRLRIGKREKHVANDGTVTPYRQFQYVLAVSPLTWDIILLDQGSYYRDDAGDPVKFTSQNKEFGLLDGSGGQLADDADPVFKNFKNKKRVPFAPLNLPSVV